jgi:hypothetical protein
MKNSKLVLIGIIITITSIYILKTNNSSKTKKQTILEPNKIYIENLSDSTNEGNKKQISYLMKSANCNIQWLFTKGHNNSENEISIRLSYPQSSKCNLNFKEQVKLHKKILSRAFKDWNKKLITSISTSSFNTINPSSEWNIRIVNAGVVNKILSEYKKNYPEHKSKFSINQIFVDITNTSNAYKELKDMFNDFGLNIELESCEKVFNGNAGKIREFGIQLTRFGSMIYDAGLLVFKVKR